MRIDWWTLTLQAINFLVLVWLLQRFLYRPVRRVISERQRTAQMALAEAQSAQQQAEAERQRLQVAREALADEREQLLKAAHERIEHEREQTLEAAREAAGEQLASVRKALEEERRQALAGLRDTISELAVAVAARVLEQTTSAALSETFLERIDEYLRQMPDDELAELRQQLVGTEGKLILVTASTLDERDRVRWQSRLGQRLATDLEVSFRSDRALIGGAELHFPHAVLRFTWAQALEQASAELIGHDRPA